MSRKLDGRLGGERRGSARVRTGRPEGLVVVEATLGIPALRVGALGGVVHGPRNRGLPRAEEEERPAAVQHHDPSNGLTVRGLERQRRIGSDGFGNLLGEALHVRRCVGPDDLDERKQRLADGAARAVWVDGHRTSVTTATRMPATAPARPFLAVSLLMMRLMKLGDWESGVFDMMNLPGGSADDGRGGAEDDGGDFEGENEGQCASERKNAPTNRIAGRGAPHLPYSAARQVLAGDDTGTYSTSRTSS